MDKLRESLDDDVDNSDSEGTDDGSEFTGGDSADFV